MTYPDDRNRPSPDHFQVPPAAPETGWSMTTLVIGGIATLAVIFGLIFMLSGSPTGPNTAANVERPVTTPMTTPTRTPTTAPAQPRATETTGSGASTRPGRADTTVPIGTTTPPQ